MYIVSGEMPVLRVIYCRNRPTVGPGGAQLWTKMPTLAIGQPPQLSRFGARSIMPECLWHVSCAGSHPVEMKVSRDYHINDLCSARIGALQCLLNALHLVSK